MQSKTKFILFIVAVIVIVGGIGITSLVFSGTKATTSNLEGFAKCLNDSGAQFYGAFWCPHCQAQKEDFVSAQKYLPYVECSSADGMNQLQVCKDAGIEAYPTWVLGDGSHITGEVSLQDLSLRTGCLLPQ